MTYYKYLDHYKYLQSSEIARLTGRSIKQVNEWRRKAGKTSVCTWGTNQKKRPFIGTKPSKVVVPIVTDPIIWDNAEWFREQYETKQYGMPLIARMIQRKTCIVYNRLKKYGIPTRGLSSITSKNPCCDYKWLDENYVIQEFSLRKCAKLANVNPYTIINWLTKFGIHIRDKYEAMSGDRNAFYGRKHTPEVKAYCRKLRYEQYFKKTGIKKDIGDFAERSNS